MNSRSKFCMIGIPDHQAVIGRLGAQGGPAAFFKAFSSLNGICPIQKLVQKKVMTQGISQDVRSNHLLATREVEKNHRNSGLSVVIGGGHDHGYSHLLGVKNALLSHKKSLKISCINIDAHLDVRKPHPQITSGSPFYLALENQVIHPSLFVEFGIQSHCNASELWEYVISKKVSVVPFESLRRGKAVLKFQSILKKLSQKSDVIVISLDLDAVAAAFAPGVSAPQAEGFSSSEIIEMMEIAGKEKKCLSLGIFELNPEHDPEGLTARLAATAAYHFIEACWQAKKVS